jgi:hypothetical protein
MITGRNPTRRELPYGQEFRGRRRRPAPRLRGWSRQDSAPAFAGSQRDAENIAGFVFHRATMRGSAHAQTLLQCVINVADRHPCHGGSPFINDIFLSLIANIQRQHPRDVETRLRDFFWGANRQLVVGDFPREACDACWQLKDVDAKLG